MFINSVGQGAKYSSHSMASSRQLAAVTKFLLCSILLLLVLYSSISNNSSPTTGKLLLRRASRSSRGGLKFVLCSSTLNWNECPWIDLSTLLYRLPPIWLLLLFPFKRDTTLEARPQWPMPTLFMQRTRTAHEPIWILYHYCVSPFHHWRIWPHLSFLPRSPLKWLWSAVKRGRDQVTNSQLQFTKASKSSASGGPSKGKAKAHAIFSPDWK